VNKMTQENLHQLLNNGIARHKNQLESLLIISARSIRDRKVDKIHIWMGRNSFYSTMKTPPAPDAQLVATLSWSKEGFKVEVKLEPFGEGWVKKVAWDAFFE
jgi:hypothetical protein